MLKFLKELFTKKSDPTPSVQAETTPVKDVAVSTKTATKPKATTTKAKAATTKAKAATTKAKATTTKAKAATTKAKAATTKAKATTTKAKAATTKAKATTTKAKATTTKAKATTTKAKATTTKPKASDNIDKLDISSDEKIKLVKIQKLPVKKGQILESKRQSKKYSVSVTPQAASSFEYNEAKKIEVYVLAGSKKEALETLSNELSGEEPSYDGAKASAGTWLNGNRYSLEVIGFEKNA